jgi:hypothetical protein
MIIQNYTQTIEALKYMQDRLNEIGFLPLAVLVFICFIIGLIIYFIFIDSRSWKNEKGEEINL